VTRGPLVTRGALAPYRAIFDSRAREELQYRAAALAGLFTQVVFGFILIMVLLAFYGSSDAVSPLTVPQTVAYVWLGQALLGLLPWNVDPKARDAIRTGDVVQELLRPVETYRMWFARGLAWRVIRTALRFVPMVALAMVALPLLGLDVYAMPAPASGGALAAFVVAIGLSALLSTAITLLIQVVMLWTVSPEGVLRIIPAVTIFLSGGLVPLPLFPEWMQPFMARQPFRGLVDTPSRIYGGDLIGPEMLGALAWSVVWIVVLVAIGRVGLARGLRGMVVAGG
jgi:ABC-2 type transport system permease protein